MQDNGNTIATETLAQEGEQLQSAAVGYIMLGFEFLLVLILIGIAVYFFSSKRKASVESPKYSMMEDDDDDDSK